MTFLIILIIAVSIYDILDMKKHGYKKEIAVYLVFTALTIGIGWLYYFHPNQSSFANLILGLFHMKE